jgi:hypothetical protein
MQVTLFSCNSVTRPRTLIYRRACGNRYRINNTIN